MYNKNLGALEEFVLLLILIMEGDAYTVTLSNAYKQQTGKSISLPAMHTVLRQLQQKDFVKSKIGGSTKERGGRSKRIYKITAVGYKILKQVYTDRDRLWKQAPKISFS